MAVRINISPAEKEVMKSIWKAQPRTEMELLWVRLLIKKFGIGTDTRKISKRDKFFRKKYMGVWSFRSRVIRVMMRKLLIRISRYITRKNTPETVCNSWMSENPVRMNPVILLKLGILDSSSDLPGRRNAHTLTETQTVTLMYRNAQWKRSQDST